MKKSLLLFSIVLLTNIFAVVAQPITWNWAASIGGKANYDSNVDLARDAQGNIYIVGDFTGTKNFGIHTLVATGFSEVFVAKFDAAGNCDWAIKAGANFSSAFAGGITLSGTQLYVAGKFINNINCGGQFQSTTGNNDAFIMQLDPSSGGCNWLEKAGGIYDDQATNITAEIGGGVLMCGTFAASASFGSFTLNSGSVNNFDMYLAKYSNTGSCVWVKQAGGPTDDKANSVKQLPSGAIFMTGYFQGIASFGTINVTSSNNYDFFLAKYDAAGTIVWVQIGGGNGNDIGYGVSVDANTNIYVTGFIGDTATFGTTTIFDNEYGSIIVAKYSNAGVLQWIKTAGGNIDDSGYDIDTDAGGSSYVTGYVNGNANFSGTVLTGGQARDGFVAKYDPTGVVRWVTRIGSTSFDYGKSVVKDLNGYCYVAGDFTGTINLGANQIISPPGEWGVYLARLGGGTVDLKDEITNTPFTLFPNPANDYLQLNITNVSDAIFTIEVLSVEGKLVSSTRVNQAQVQSGYKMNVAALQNGSYLLKIVTSKGDFTRPFLVAHP